MSRGMHSDGDLKQTITRNSLSLRYLHSHLYMNGLCPRLDFNDTLIAHERIWLISENPYVVEVRSLRKRRPYQRRYPVCFATPLATYVEQCEYMRVF